MIDSGSPIKIFTQVNLREFLKVDVIFASSMPKTEQKVDYNNKPLKTLGLMTVNVKVRKRTIKNARTVISRDGKRSLIGRDWLNQLNFRVGEANGNYEYSNIINHISERQNLEQLNKFPELFRDKRKRIRNHFSNIRHHYPTEGKTNPLINAKRGGRRNWLFIERRSL